MTTASDLVIVSNRLPVHRVERQGRKVWETSPGGLVSALKPVLRKHRSTWLGWAGAADTRPPPFEHDGVFNRSLSLSAEEMDHYYEGFCNRTLWPLFHDGIRTPAFHRTWWRSYVEVNNRFAEATASVVAEGGVVWIHDYHLMLVPQMLRDRRPDIRIGFFLHIPFPPPELFVQLPWRERLIEGVMGADVIGFQTDRGARNFRRLAKRFTGAPGSGARLQFGGRTVVARDFPISIDFARFEELAGSQRVRERAAQLRAKIGSRRRVILGVDRLDYTKGIDIRIKAFGELLRSGRVTAEDTLFVQVAVPSRERVEEYRTLRSSVENLVGSINGEFGELGRMPLQYMHRSLDISELVAFYRLADVMVVTPIRDGMNLVAKEYVACRTEETGALILSEFTGSANELTQALLVNPHDVDGLMRALESALHLSAAEQKRRIHAMRRQVKRHDVYRWADAFFAALHGDAS